MDDSVKAFEEWCCKLEGGIMAVIGTGTRYGPRSVWTAAWRASGRWHTLKALKKAAEEMDECAAVVNRRMPTNNQEFRDFHIGLSCFMTAADRIRTLIAAEEYQPPAVGEERKEEL